MEQTSNIQEEPATPYIRSAEAFKVGGGGASCCGPLACCLFICCCVLPAIAVGAAYYYANKTMEASGADNWQDYLSGYVGGDGESGYNWQDIVNNMDDETISQYKEKMVNGDDDTIASYISQYMGGDDDDANGRYLRVSY